MATSVGGIKIDLALETKKLRDSVKQATKELGKVNKAVKKQQSAFKRGTSTLKDYAKALGGLFIGAKFKDLISSSFRFNQSMEDAEGTLRAMIASSTGFKTTLGEVVSEQERWNIVNEMTKDTMSAIQEIMPRTAMGLADLAGAYALIKPTMDQAGIGMKQQIHLLELVANSATNFKMSGRELQTGIDDLGRGTIKTASAFGKMMTSLGVTNEAIKASGDVYGYLTGKLKESGKMADTMTVAVSNLKESWGLMLGEVTKPIWEPLKGVIKDVSEMLGKHGVSAAKSFGKAFAVLAKVIISASSAMVTAISGVVNTIGIAIKGYQMLGKLGSSYYNKAKASVLEKFGGQGLGGIFAGDTVEGLRAKANASMAGIKALDNEVKNIALSQKGLTDSIIEMNVEMWQAPSNMEAVKKSGKELANTLTHTSEAAKTAGKAVKKAAKSAGKAGVDSMKLWEDAIRNVRDQNEEMKREIEQGMQFFDDMGNTIQNGIGDALLSITDKTQKFGDVMRNVLNSIASQLMNSALKGLFGGSRGTGSGIGDWLSGLFSFNATGGIVNSPSIVGMQGGKMAVAGEAGPEAIMPITRVNGELGIKAAPVNITIKNLVGGEVSVEQDGDNYDIIVSRLTREIQKGSGNFGSTLEQRYGMRKV